MAKRTGLEEAKSLSKAVGASIASTEKRRSASGDLPLGQVVEHATTLMKSGLAVWEKYVSLAETQEKTRQIIVKEAGEIRKVELKLRQDELAYEAQSEARMDKRSVIAHTISMMEFTRTMLALVIRGYAVDPSSEGLAAAITLNKDLVTMMISLHRLAEK